MPGYDTGLPKGSKAFSDMDLFTRRDESIMSPAMGGKQWKRVCFLQAVPGTMFSLARMAWKKWRPTAFLYDGLPEAAVIALFEAEVVSRAPIPCRAHLMLPTRFACFCSTRRNQRAGKL